MQKEEQVRGFDKECGMETPSMEARRRRNPGRRKCPGLMNAAEDQCGG